MNTSDISDKVLLQTPDRAAAHPKKNKKLADGSIDIADEEEASQEVATSSPELNVMGPMSPRSDASFNSTLNPNEVEVDHLIISGADVHSATENGGSSVKKIKKVANEESPVLKSQEIFGAVKVKDGLFLGDQYSA